MALTSDQLVTISEITYETYDTIESLVGNLNPAQENSISDDLDTWESIRDSHVRLSGGGDGLDFDNNRKREAIRVRIRNMLGLDPYIDLQTLGNSGSQAIRHTWAW